MHACRVLYKLLQPALDALDVRNARNLLTAADALLLGRRLTLMELARHWPGAARVRAPLKRLDRLLSNPHVHAARARVYAAAITGLLGSPMPVLIVDWSELKSDGRWHLLRAGVIARGRTLTVYEEVHPECDKASPQVEAAFLGRLKTLLPAHVRPIVVTDAGFRVPWFRTVQALNWHWLGRVRQRSRVRPVNTVRPLGCWASVKTLYAKATGQPRTLGLFELTESKRHVCRLVLVRRPKRGRVQLTRTGAKVRAGSARKIARRECEPWLLATSVSLTHLPARTLVRLYTRRMQIEQSFRDLKSHRFGCAFEDTLTRDPQRLQMLLLIHALATLAAWLKGLAIASETLARSRRWARYSVVWIGWERLRQTSRRLSEPIANATTRLQNTLAHAAESD